MGLRNRIRFWLERRTCSNTTVELQAVKMDGYKSQVRMRVICKCHEWVLGEAYFGPDRIVALCHEAERLAAEIRPEYQTNRH